MKSRRMAGAAILATAALALTACSGADSTDTNDGGGGDGGDLSGTLTFASWQFLEPNRGDVIFDAINSYTEENSDVTIEKEDITRDDYEKTLSTEFGSGAGPDVFIIPDAFFPQLTEAGILAPLDDMVEAADNDAFRDINENYAVDGTQYGVVWEVVPYSLYWNKNILDEAGVEPPTDVDSLVDAIETIEDKTGKTGFTVRHQMNEETPWWTDYSNWTFGFGGSYSDGEKLTIDSSENIAALEAFDKVYNADGFGKGQDASTYRSAFAAGELGMAIDNSSAVLTQVSDDVPADDIGSAVLPFPAGGSAFAGFSIGVNANSDNLDAAKDFIRYLLTEDAQKQFADALFPSAIATDVDPSQELVDENPWTDAFFEQVNNANSVIIAGFEDDTSEIAHEILKQVSRTVTEGISPEEALSTAQEKAEELVN